MRAERCNCEHIEHETPNEAIHPYMGVAAGEQRAMHVGAICDDCANGHLAEYVLNQQVSGGGA